MNKQEIDEVNRAFLALKKESTPQQWKRPQYLIRKAKALEASNVALSYRVIQRVKNLRPNNPNVDRLLEHYKSLVDKASPVEPDVQASLTTSETPKTVSDQSKVNADLENKRYYIIEWLTKPISLFVFLPWLLFTLYLTLWASPRYQSQAQLIVQQPDGIATMDASMALLSGLGVSSSNTDTELVKAYIFSSDMLSYLDGELSLREHYQSDSNDVFSKLASNASQEDFLEYYLNHISVEIDESSSVISVYAQGFDSFFAWQLSQALVERAEWFINEIGHQLAEEQLKFVQTEHELVESKLREAQTKLLTFQQTYGLLDPEAEGAAMQQITYSIEGQIAVKKSELRTLLGVMSETAPKVQSLENEISALEHQLINERGRLSAQENKKMSVSAVLAKFTDLKVDMELALKAFTSSQISLEKSRIEAYRQLKYLVVVETPTKPEDYTFPDVIYNSSLFFIVLLLLFGIIKIIITTIKELN